MARVMNKKVTTARKPLQSIKNKNTLVDIKEKNPGRASAGQIAKNKATRAAKIETERAPVSTTKRYRTNNLKRF
jgi:hypothetical protein